MVTQGAFIGTVLATWLAGDPRQWRKYDAPNCSITIVVQDNSPPNSGWRGEMVNDVRHLPPMARIPHRREY
jgi:broad specificity phosphatase PhoE